MRVTEKYLRDNPEEVFVFGDNLARRGRAGGARLRHMRNSYGFVTKKAASMEDRAFYRPREYRAVFERELGRFLAEARRNPGKVYLFSRVGAGLANRFGIWEEVVEPGLRGIREDNIVFLWDRFT